MNWQLLLHNPEPHTLVSSEAMRAISLRLWAWPRPRPRWTLDLPQHVLSPQNIGACGSSSCYRTHFLFLPTSYQTKTTSTNAFRLQAVGAFDYISPVSGLEDVMIGYIIGKKKATEVAHSVWKHVIQKGDVVIDATCGNGYDTLVLLKLVKDDSGNGCVYGFDIQEDAINNTSSLIDMSLGPTESKHVELFSVCHSRMLQLLPKGISVRLVAFNLGYLPGSDKTIITKSSTTLLALEAAKEMVVPGGLISAVVYVGHPGGREEFETIQGFASGLSAEEWVCTQIQTLNRPSAPILVFLFKR